MIFYNPCFFTSLQQFFSYLAFHFGDVSVAAMLADPVLLLSNKQGLWSGHMQPRKKGHLFYPSWKLGVDICYKFCARIYTEASETSPHSLLYWTTTCIVWVSLSFLHLPVCKVDNTICEAKEWDQGQQRNKIRRPEVSTPMESHNSSDPPLFLREKHILFKPLFFEVFLLLATVLILES